MYKDDNMTQFTLPMETSVLIPINDIVKQLLRLNSINSFVQTIPKQNHLQSTVKEKSM